ncbi:MAG: HYR domain-containing protein [Acidobacteriota bacterium]
MKSNPHFTRVILLAVVLISAWLLSLAGLKLVNADTGIIENSTYHFSNSTDAGDLDPAMFYAVYTVDNLGDTGAGTGTTGDFRYCLSQANAAGGSNTINFSVTGTINLSSALPAINNDLTINGPGANALTINGNNFAVVFNISTNKTVNINGVTITGGNGTSLVAGGIDNSGNLTLNGCHITGNAGKFAGGLQNLGSLTVLNSTFSNNTATLTGFNNGGGISQSNNGVMLVTNTTISGNQATAFGNANGGILIFDGTAVITNSTITDNKGGTNDSVGGIRRNFGLVVVRNSIVAANRNNSTVPDVGGGLTSQGYNLIGNVGGEVLFDQPGDQTGTGAAPLDPLVAPLTNNGGTTPTHALYGGSPTIDKGLSFDSVIDQRGLARTFDDPNIASATGGDNTDIGAYEAQTVLPSFGNYPNTSVPLGANTTITPSAPPFMMSRVSVSTSAKFKGTLTANPVTGVVRVTNAYPSGIYTLTLNGFGANGVGRRSFTLTVQSGTPCENPLAFTYAPDVALNPFSNSLAVGDFNEDGRQDFVAGYDSPDPASVRLGDGAGNFSGSTTVSAQPFIRAIVVGDFNEDGHQDLGLSNNSVLRSVSIRLGDGAGNFSGTLNVPTGAIPNAVAIGDFNGDGHQDLATANEIDNTVSIRFGDGQGNFSGTSEIAVGERPYSIAVSDFNGDGKLDFATANLNGNAASVRLGNGAGSFANAPDIALGGFQQFVVAGDFNSDNKPDLAIAMVSVNVVAIRLGDGAGNFSGMTNVPVSSGPACIALGDFNNDAKLDFATTNIGFGTVSVRLGDGSGNFTGFTPTSEVTVNPNPRYLAVADFNGDDFQDFVVVHFNAQNSGAIRLNSSCPPPNTPPTITAVAPLSRQKAAPAINSKIAAVNDDDQTANTLTVTATPLSGTGVSITNISVAVNGDVTADVTADCGATNSTFTLTVSDAQLASATETLTVNVTPETTPPAIECPANITQSTDLNQCLAVVNYTLPAANDNCPGVGTVVCSPASGSNFQKGVTTVTCTVSDASGNPASCSFTITVNDTQAPNMLCPPNITMPTDTNLCSAAVTYPPLNPTDNCPGVGSVTCTPASGSTFQKGITTVTCSVSDASNNTAVCTFTVTINDTQNPTITCPTNITQSTDSGVCTAVVNFTTPTPADNCPGATVACVPATGSTFNKGITTITCTATDTSNNAASCTFTVTINDTQQPTINCPANKTVSTDANQCSAVVTYTSATATDNCPGVGTVTCTPPSGSTFQKGTTTVTCSVSDAATPTANSASCTFTITVNDTQPPSIACPAPVTVPTTSNQCSAVVTYTMPTGTDNCPGVGAVTCVPPSGSTFPKGITSVTCSVSDAAGNSTNCSFAVTVNDTQNPTLSCPANITQTTTTGCLTVTYTTPTGSDNCPGVAVNCVPPSGTCFAVGTTTVTCTATDTSNNSASCLFTVTIIPCTISCPADVVKANDTNQCGALVNYPSPSTTGNCGTVVCSPPTGSFFAKGVTTVSCTTTVGPSCAFTVTVNDTESPGITCPSNISQSTDANVCQAVVNYPTPAVTDNCSGVGAVACSPASGATFTKGTTTVNCSVSDAAGNSAACSFTITVNDTQQPNMTCPANITTATAPNQCQASVSYQTPVATDNCPGVGGVTCLPNSGSVFAKGVTTVTCTVSDAAGNTRTCSFTVTVNDMQPPGIVCPANLTVPTLPDLCAATVNYQTPMATDNCPGITIACVPPSGASFPKGTTMVACTATDASGNKSSCSFTITINDTQAPTISCPQNITAPIAPNQSCVVVNYPAPQVSDNCPGESVVCVPPSGSCFGLGVTTVSCTATDASGNTANCSFVVTTFDICIQDDSNATTVLLLNSLTGDYVFCCGVDKYFGKGTVTKRGGVITLTHNPSDRRVLATINQSVRTATGSLQSPPGTLQCSIADRNILDNSCNCTLPNNRRP